MHVSTCTRPRARVPTCTHAHACNSDSRTRLNLALYVYCLCCLAVEVDRLYPRKIKFLTSILKTELWTKPTKQPGTHEVYGPLDRTSCIVLLFSSLSATAPTVLLVLRIIIHRKIHINGYPITGLEWPLGHQELEVPRNSRQSAHEDGKIVSSTHRPPLPPWDIPGTHFC